MFIVLHLYVYNYHETEDPLVNILTLSNPIFLPTAYSPALICFGRERGWLITCNYPTVFKREKHRETERIQPALSVG